MLFLQSRASAGRPAGGDSLCMIGLLPLLNALFRPGRRGAAHTPSPGTDASGYYAYTALRDPDPSSSSRRSSRSTRLRRAVPAAVATLSKMSSSSKILRMVKKWQRSSGTKAAAAADRAYSSLHHHGDGGDGGRDDGGGKLPARGGDDDEAGGADVDGVVPDGCVEIYVGREKRRYVIDAAFLEREVIKRLIEKSNQKQEGFGGGGGGEAEQTAGLSIACEVVLFEHLLWLLKNGSWYDHETDDLADFYAC